MLVYLSETNLQSGTSLYDENDKLITDVKFIQNRALIFDSRYSHAAINNHGTLSHLGAVVKPVLASGVSNSDTQMANISKALGQIAAGINALKGHQSNMYSLSANARAAASRIQDTDFAKESANLAQSSILNQSALAMVAQANNAQAYILTLLN